MREPGSGTQQRFEKEVRLKTLIAVQLIDDRKSDAPIALEFVRPFLLLRHQQRFQTSLSKAFEEMLSLSS
jgi:hypothetical protein